MSSHLTRPAKIQRCPLVAPLNTPASVTQGSPLFRTTFVRIAAIDVPEFPADTINRELPDAADANPVAVRSARESGDIEHAAASSAREPRTGDERDNFPLRRPVGRPAATSSDDAWWAAAVDGVLADFDVWT